MNVRRQKQLSQTYVISSKTRPTVDTIREEFNVIKLRDQYKYHTYQKKNEKEETKPNKRQCPSNSVQVQDS